MSVDEYLNSSWHPDKEYVDGLLVERPLPTVSHALLQIILGAFFYAVRRQYNCNVLSEARTVVKDRRRYRLPDIQLCPRLSPTDKLVEVVPWVIIEILSPDDTHADMQKRFVEYRERGVPNALLMDPERYAAYRLEGQLLVQFHKTELTLPTGASIPFDADAIFEELRLERATD